MSTEAMARWALQIIPASVVLRKVCPPIQISRPRGRPCSSHLRIQRGLIIKESINKMVDQHLDRKVIKSDPKSYIMLCGFPALFIVACCFRSFGSLSDQLQMIGIVLFIFLFVNVWIASFKIILTSDTLTFGQLFRPTRTITFDDILKTQDHVGFDKTTTNVDGMYRLLIFSKRNPHEPYIVINLKMFKPADVQYLERILKPYSAKGKSLRE
jgi:hypothetical protein